MPVMRCVFQNTSARTDRNYERFVRIRNDMAEIRTWPLPNTNQKPWSQLPSFRCPVKGFADVNAEITNSTNKRAREVIFALCGSREEYAFHTYRPEKFMVCTVARQVGSHEEKTVKVYVATI
jgi:hypothetical protein